MRDFKSARVPDATSRWLRLRVTLVGAVFLLLLCAAFARAVQLQVFQRDALREMAADQSVREIDIPARRGDIFDRRGVPLAQSVEVDSIWIDPSGLEDVRGAAKQLAKKLKLDPEELTAKLTKARRFAWVKRQARPEEVAAVKALGLPGVGFAKEPRRFYPQRELAAQVVGLVGTDGHGLEGLELAFEDELSGAKSRLSGLRDARGRKLLTEGTQENVDGTGAAVTLTLDRQIQYVTEKALGRAVEDAKGVSGMAVVLDPHTGEVMALANWPRFNPNTPAELTSKALMRNHAALDLFEPGSTFKAFLVAAALEEKAIKPEDVFFCENGAWPVGRHVIHDTHKHGWLTPEKVLMHSSNIGAGKIAQALGREKMVAAYQRFGFGERAGLALPGEGKGSIPFPKAEVALVTQSFGQGLSATAMQLAAAFGALANGGVLLRPYLVSKVVDPDGVVLLENRPTEVRRVVSEKVAKQVIAMLETVVLKEGTAPRARMDEYRVAGKTGTAQKADPVARGYSDKRIASFIGAVPAEAPRAVILVVIDEPKVDIYGGLSAAPAFKEIAQATMPYLAVPPSVSAPVATLAAPEGKPSGRGPAVVAAAVPAVAKAKAGNKEAKEVLIASANVGAVRTEGVDAEGATDAITEERGEGMVEVPDLAGTVGREAVVRLLGAALRPRLLGSGRVVTQSPSPGARVERGSLVTLELTARQ